MHTLIFQLVFKQWDKSQRSPECQAAIRNSQDRYPLNTQPQFMLFDTQCVLEQYALDFSAEPLENATPELLSQANAGRTITKSLLTDGRAKLDRFILTKPNGVFQLAYENEKGVVTLIGEMNNGWLQAKYEWRYRVERNNEIFWLYEEVTLNAALVESIQPELFLTQPPSIRFNTADI